MKTIVRVQWIACWVLMLTLFSCTEQVEPIPFEYTKIFTGENSKTWRIVRVVTREEGKRDASISLSACESDDRYTFYANEEKLYEVTNGNTKCDAEEDDMLVSYTWGFSNANSTMTIVIPHFFGNFIIPFIVTDADEDEMELEVFANQENTISYVFFFEVVDEN